MSEEEVRAVIVDALQAANVEGIVGDPRVSKFLQGKTDIKFAQLNMDSLASMEFCISIELETGVSLAPEELRSIKTLNRLAKIIRDQ